MSLTPFTKMLAEFFFREREQDPKFSKARLANILGVHRSTVGRWLDGDKLPDPQEQSRVLFHLGILGNCAGVQMTNAKVAGRVFPGTGSVELCELPLEDSIPISYLEYLLRRDPLWSLTTGDPLLFRLDGGLPGYEMMENKVAARKPHPSSLLEIPSGALAIARLMEERDHKYPNKVDWRHECVYIHRISNVSPFLEYSTLGISGVHYILAHFAFEILALVIPYETATTAE